MSIADLFRVQQAAAESPNPMDPNIGKSTSLPPQLLDLLKQSAAAEQAQMRQQAQVQGQQGNAMPTVADTVRQKAATLNQQAQSQQAQQQELMQQLMRAKQAPQAFQAGGIVALPKRYAAGGDVEVDPDIARMRDLQSARERYQRAGSDTRAIDEALSSLYGKMREGQTEKFYKGRPSPGKPTASPAGIEAIQAMTEPPQEQPKPRATVSGGGGGIGALKQAVAPAQETQAAPAAPAAQAAAPADGQGTYGEYVRRMLEEKGPNRDAEIERAMKLRQQYGPAGSEADFIKQQMGRRDAEIAKAEQERPGITQIITAMAQAARANDAQRRNGSGAAALLGAAEFTQASKKEREAKVKELQAAKDTMLQKLAALEDAKKSGDLQAVVAADGEARQAAQKLQEKQAQAASTMGSQELQNASAEKRNAADIAARASEGDKDRANRLQQQRIAASAVAARGAGGPGGGAQNRIMQEFGDLQAKVMDGLAKDPRYALAKNPQEKARMQNEAMASALALNPFLRPYAAELLQSPGAPTTGPKLSPADQALVDKYSSR